MVRRPSNRPSSSADGLPKPVRSAWKTLLRIGSAVLAAFAVAVTFSDQLVRFKDNISKLLNIEPAKITLTNATSTVSKGAPSVIPVKFTVVVEHEKNDLQCSGEGSGMDVMLSSSDDRKVSIAEGKQSKELRLEIPSGAVTNFRYDLLSFRLSCDHHFGKTPYIPVNVEVQNIEPQRQPSAPTQSYKVCAGNGGGPSCQANAAAYYTCAQYRSIGGGAQATYDTLGRRLCEYQKDGQSALAPYKVLHDFSVAGGECGWTGFTVICNP